MIKRLNEIGKIVYNVILLMNLHSTNFYFWLNQVIYIYTARYIHIIRIILR